MGVSEASATYRLAGDAVPADDGVPQGYKRTEVGLIPEDWGVVNLSGLSEVLTGLTYRPSDVDSGGVLVLRSSNVQEGRLAFDDNVYVLSRAVADNVLVQPGDILVCVRNGSRDLIGKSALIPEINAPVAFGAFMAVLRSSEPSFVHHAFRSEVVQKQVREQLGATINQITRAGFDSFLLPAPSRLTERTAIAEALSDADALIESLQQLIAKKRALKQGAMQALLTGRQRLPGYASEWGRMRLGDVVKLIRDNVVPMSLPNETFLHFSLPAFDDGRVAVKELGSVIGSNKFRVPQNAILVSKLNPRIPRVWTPKVIPKNSVCSTEFLVFVPAVGMRREFISCICSSPAFCEQMELAATGTTGSHQRMNPSDALDIRVQVPVDASEQTAIATVLSDMDAEIDALQARLAKTRDLKAGMMQALLTGRIRLPLDQAA